MATPNRPDGEAEKELRARIRAGSQKLEDYDALADLLLDSPGREEEGLAVLEEALKLPLPEIRKARISAEITSFLYQLNQPERAMTMARLALSQLPQQAEGPDALLVRVSSHATLTNCLYSVDRAVSEQEARLALEALEQLLRRYPESEDFIEASLHAAAVYMLWEKHAKAATLCQEAIRRDRSGKNRLSLLLGLAQGLRFQGQYAEAEVRLRDALNLIREDKRLLHRIYFEMGMVQRLTNRPEQATVSFERALAALDFNPALRDDRGFTAEVKWELGHLYYLAGRYGEAISALREVLPDLPEPYPYWYALTSIGHCYLASGQYAKARDCYEEVLAAAQASHEDKAAAREGLSRLPTLPPPRLH